MPADFDLHALHQALDAKRASLDLSWTALGDLLGMSASTLRTLGTRPVAEGDGVLRAVAWLGRSPESFVPGRRFASHADGNALLPNDASRLRFDVPALFAAVDTARRTRGATWRQLASECGVGSVTVLTRMRAGGRVMFPTVMRILAWLGEPACRFVRLVER